MGAYLSEPITEKISSDEVGERLACGASSMQGWRINQEDAHNCIIDFDKNTSLFAVFDGHGGHEVALYCSQHLPNFLKNLESYKANDFEKALVEAFIDFDATLATPEVVAILKELAGPKEKEEAEGSVDPEKSHSSDEENENVYDLYEEATMPLEKVIEKYQNQQVGKLQKDEKSPSSPYLRAKPGGSSSDGAGSSGESKISKEEESGVKKESLQSGDSPSGSGVSLENKDEVEKTKETNGTDSPDCGDEGPKQNGLVNGEHVDSPSKKGKAKAAPPKRNPRRIASIKDKLNLNEKDIQQIYNAILTANDDSDDTDEDEENDDEFQVEPTKAANSGDEDDDDEEEEEGDEDSESEEDDEDDDDEEFKEDYDMPTNMIEEPGFESGCTAVVALLRDDKLYVANAGDSRCIVSRNGKVIEMSFDHKPESEEEHSRITKAGGKVTSDGRVNGGLNLSRALGDHAYKQNKELPAKEQMITALPDINTISIDLAEDEFMVLACDGIWNFMSNEEVVEFVGTRLKDGQQKISEICEEMFDHCLAPNTMGDGTGCDNMTAIIVQFKRDADSKVTVISGGSKRAASPTPEEDSTKRAKITEKEDASETKSSDEVKQ